MRCTSTMTALRIIVAALALGARAHSSSVISRSDDLTLTLQPQQFGGFDLVMQDGEERNVIGVIGRTLVSNYILEDVENGVSVRIGNVNLTVDTVYDTSSGARGIKIWWEGETGIRLEDCISFGSKHWYAGPMQFNQTYPLEKTTHPYAAYVTKEQDNGAISERYWLNSDGEYYYVHPEVPLFVDYGNLLSDHICFGAQVASPYSTDRNRTVLGYDVWFHSDAKIAHMHAVANYLGKPTDVVDKRMVQYPIWSTWAQFSREIDEDNLIEFATNITDNGFPNAQFEIDDLWEVCYGSLTVNTNKFSNFSKTVADLKSMGFRVTLWAHPFINSNCNPWYNDALANGYLVLNEDGSPSTSWWNSNGSDAAYIDFTNPAAASWWAGRLQTILDTYDIDSVKFDAGESSFSPQVPRQTGDIEGHPHHISQEYVKTCAQFGDMIEVRTGFRTQNLPIFVRMVDRDSTWGLNNGLSTIITTTMQMNLAGYTLVLPDMIGGNGFNLNNEQSALPTKELFIRWVQANTFLPAMQFSYVPWNFDNETTTISKKYVELHAAHADDVMRAMENSVQKGTPVNAPIWWLDPSDVEAQVIWDEYLLGEDILVAPVLDEGAVSRDIYLPVGTWLAEGDSNRTYEGRQWLRNYSAPIDTLPYFIRKTEPDSAVAPTFCATLVLLGLIMHLFY